MTRQGASVGVAMPWESLFAAPVPGQHIAQLYRDRAFLARAVGRWVGDGLRNGEGVVIIATPLHWRAALQRLEADDLHVQRFRRQGQLLVRDAEETLAELMRDGHLDRDRFRATIGGALDVVQGAGFARIRAFGEMVDVLRRSDVVATLRLEALWNELLAERGIALLCGYSLDTFDPRIYRGLLQQVSGRHSDLIPVEDYARLEQAVDRAWEDLFGGSDAEDLRRAFLQHYPRPAAMPDAEAAILALQEFLPGAADALLAGVRDHYDAPPV